MVSWFIKIHIGFVFLVPAYTQLGCMEKRPLNSKPKKPGLQAAKTGFSVLKKLRVTRFFGFGKNRVGNPIGDRRQPRPGDF